MLDEVEGGGSPTGVEPDGEGAGQAVIAVSACLVGKACRYDGGTKPLVDLSQRLGGAKALPICPEVLAGLGVPRRPMTWHGGDARAARKGYARLLDSTGRDCTAQLEEGVRRAMDAVRLAGCRRALLKERSPSCGVYNVHTEVGLVAGQGLWAAALADEGVELATEECSWPSPKL